MFFQLIENAFYPLDSLALRFLLREMKQVARNRVDFGLVAVPVRHSQIRDFLHFVEERLEIALNFERIFRKLEFSRNISQNRKIPVWKRAKAEFGKGWLEAACSNTGFARAARNAVAGESSFADAFETSSCVQTARVLAAIVESDSALVYVFTFAKSVWKLDSALFSYPNWLITCPGVWQIQIPSSHEEFWGQLLQTFGFKNVKISINVEECRNIIFYKLFDWNPPFGFLQKNPSPTKPSLHSHFFVLKNG